MPERDLVGFMTSRGLQYQNSPAKSEEILSTLDLSARTQLNDALANLIDSAPDSPIQLAQEKVGDTRTVELGIRLSHSSGSSGSIYYWRVTDAIGEAWLSVASVTIVAVMGLPGYAIIVPTTQVILSLWRNLKKLEKPADNGAINLYFAVQKSGSQETTGSVRQTLDEMDDKSFERAVSRLLDLGLLEVSRWGGETGDHLHPSNQLKLRI